MLPTCKPTSPCALLCIIWICFATIPAFAAPAAGTRFAGKPRSHAGRIQTGLDVLESQKFAPLRGKHIGIITNHTGLDSNGKSTIELLSHASGMQVIAIFSPEHGLGGQLDQRLSSSKDPSTGLHVFSLYGETLRPTDEMLQGVDTLVFDIQDAGVRFYTYTVTMAYAMEEAAKRHIAFFVLDRPNPLGGETIEGPMLDADKTDFVAYYPVPVRYGLTIGELAQFYNAENHINVDLHVIAMKNWHRNYFFASTGIRWVPPSPNLRTVKGSIVYPGLEILQNAGVSVGRGTEAPFEEFGAPWMEGEKVSSALNAAHLPGLKFVVQPFIPVSGLYAGRRCGGVGIRIGDRAAVRAMSMGLTIAALLQQMYPQDFDLAKIMVLLGNSETVQKLKDGQSPAEVVRSWQAALADYDKTRRRYFLYK